MSDNHGGPVTLKPIGEMAQYLKNLIPANIPETYALKPMFATVSSEEDIRKGVVAFRDFLYVFCDRLISDGHVYVTLPNKPKSATDYPFLYQVTDLLADIGYHGNLSESGHSLTVTRIPSFTASVDENGKKKNSKNSGSALMECLRFLALCGFAFAGIDLRAKTFTVSEAQMLEVSYPNNPILLTGLKVMAIADIELRIKRYVSDYNRDNLLRCDYRLLMADDTDTLDLLNDFVHPLPEKVQKFVLALHRRYIGMGLTCATIISTFDMQFAYSYIKNSRRDLSPKDVHQRRAWEFALSPRDGYDFIVRPKYADKYADVIEQFPSSLREKIAKGYGCDRKLRGEPCQKGCAGIRIPLDDAIVDMERDIETWLDQEVSFLLGK